jgi:amino acid transporter
VNANTIIALQSLLLFLQVLNAGIASVTHDTLIVLLIGAAVMGLSHFVNHLGNHSVPAEVSAVLTTEQKAKLAEGREPVKVDVT